MKDQHDVPVFFSALDQIAMKPTSPMKDKEFIWIGDRGGWGQVADFTNHPLRDRPPLGRFCIARYLIRPKVLAGEFCLSVANEGSELLEMNFHLQVSH